MTGNQKDKHETPWGLNYFKGDSDFYGEDIENYLEHGSSAKRRVSNDKLVSSHLSQWNYNHNRSALINGIEATKELINDLISENDVRPIYVPDNDLKILQVDVKLHGNWKDNLSLDKMALSRLFKSQASNAQEHLKKLLTRVQDTSSKVFITGDLNAGKSTLCNALLRKHLLPEDQLPCTNVFCEILEARENNNIEQVHAIPISIAPTVKNAYEVYDIKDQLTYKVFSIKELDELVQKNSEYSLLKIYIKDDQRSAETSLLCNGTADIALIDSPGLNLDLVQTTEVMSRQEEIDLVIFVINAENQLTLSGKEFISMASKEKKFMFFVVNKYEHIKDKERCKKLILDQIKEISPETHKRSAEFVHFVSGNRKVPSADGGCSPDDDPDDYNDPDDNGTPYRLDFEDLEASLRNFVLKKRSTSKLMPVKTYLMKLISDVNKISLWNLKVYRSEEEAIKSDLNELTPKIQDANLKCAKLTECVDKTVENSVDEVYDFTQRSIQLALDLSPSEFPLYDGLFNIHDYLFRSRQFLIQQIKSSVVRSELYAKSCTQTAVNCVNKLAKQELGDEFMSDRVFQGNLMFTKKKHFLGKQLDVPFSIKDFFAPSLEGFLGYITWGFFTHPTPVDTQKSKSTYPIVGSLGLTDYTFDKYWSNPSLIFTSRIPALAVYSYGGVKVLTDALIYGTRFFSWQSIHRLSISLLFVGSAMSIAYLINDLPRALPMNLSLKYRKKLHELDYIHANADRIAKEVREVLKTPTREIMKFCELLLDKKHAQIQTLEAKVRNNELSVAFFQRLAQRASNDTHELETIDLDTD